MDDQGASFASLFRKFRVKSGLKTLHEFGDAMAREGLIYEDSLFSHWQKGDRIPKNRSLLLKIITVFIKKGGIATIDQINLFLASSGQGYLTLEEHESFAKYLVRQNHKNYKETDLTIEDIADNHDVYDYIRDQADMAYEKIYEGYPQIVFENMGKFLELIPNLPQRDERKAINLAARVNWVRARCLSDITKPEDFKHAYKRVLENLCFAKDMQTDEVGSSYWMALAIKRLELVTSKKKSIEKGAEECIELGEASLKYTSKDHYAEKLVNIFELAKTALILNDRKYFEEQIEDAFICASRLSPSKKYLQIIAWDALARGKIHFGEILDALKIIQVAKKNIDKKYRALNLFLKNTEYQALISVKDAAFTQLAKKLKIQIGMEAQVLGNPYQMLRLRKRKLFGL